MEATPTYDHGITERPAGEGIAWGLDAEQSPVKPDSVLVVEALTPGHRVNAFHLTAVVEQYGIQCAEDHDAACQPCPMCSLNFFDPGQRLGICNVCAALHTEEVY